MCEEGGVQRVLSGKERGRMRQIDADRLMDSLKGNVLIDVTPELEDTIAQQPTAFDMEKVINEIHISSAGIVVNMNVSSSYAEGYIDAAKDIIEIVKRGGIE